MIFAFGLMIVSALIPNAVPESWLLQLIRGHPAGTMGVSVCAISAFSVVAVLDVLSIDPIQIRFFQFELKGAAGDPMGRVFPYYGRGLPDTLGSKRRIPVTLRFPC